MVILNTTGVIKTTEEYGTTTRTQNNISNVQVKTNSEFTGSANASQDILEGSSAALSPAELDSERARFGYTLQVDITNTLQKSVFEYYTVDNRLTGPMPEYVALNGAHFVKFQGRHCVNWRQIAITDAERAAMVDKGMTTELTQQLESCSTKPAYCVGVFRRGDVYSLCTTDDLDQKYIPDNCLRRNKDNECINYEQGATHMGFDAVGTWMLVSEMRRGGISGDKNVPMKREVYHNNMEYLELRDYDRQRFECTTPITTITGTLPEVLSKCSAYDSPPGGCRAVMKTSTGYGGCEDIKHKPPPYNDALSKFVATPLLATTNQVTHVFNERLMDISPVVFNIADKFYYNRNHADFDPTLTTSVPGWSDAILDL